MTNEELIAAMSSLVSRAEAAAANANAAATTANAAADQATAGASSSVAGARTQSNTETDTGAIDRQVDSDIGVEEAWAANVKRTYDVHQTYDLETKGRNRLHFDNAIVEMQKHLANVNHLSLQALTNNQNASQLSIDRMWNINETDLAAKSAAALTDAILAELVKRAKPG